jgi:hypothetical protein
MNESPKEVNLRIVKEHHHRAWSGGASRRNFATFEASFRERELALVLRNTTCGDVEFREEIIF